MVSRLLLTVSIGCALLCQSASGAWAGGTAARIKNTATPPVIDGNGSDAVWANANVYGTATFFDAAANTALQPGPDITLEWRALWDNTNLYVMAKAHDDKIYNSRPEFGGPDSGTNGDADWRDDSIEFYIDAKNVNNSEYFGAPSLSQPTFQFTSLAGWTPAIANDATYLNSLNQPVSQRIIRNPNSFATSSFTTGVNSYYLDDIQQRYPQGADTSTSGPVTGTAGAGYDWTFEAAFPWSALEDTPANILSTRNGIFGFGVAYNDDDDGGTRDNQYIFATAEDSLWHVSNQFPDVQLVPEPAGAVLVALGLLASAACGRSPRRGMSP